MIFATPLNMEAVEFRAHFAMQTLIADQYLEALVNEHREAAPKDANAGQSCRGVR